MRVAVIFTGLPRTLEIGFLFHRNYLIEPFGADVFVHTWDVENAGYRFNKNTNILNTGRVLSTTSDISPSCFNGDVKSFIENKMCAKNYAIESYSDFENRNGGDNCTAMVYSWQKVNDLKKTYENENNFKYDLVIKVRTDILVHTYLDDAEISDSKNILYVGSHINENAYVKYHMSNSSVPDCFAFGSSELIDVYCDCIETLKKGTTLKSESLLGLHLKENNIAHKLSNVKMKMFEVYTENEWYATYHTN